MFCARLVCEWPLIARADTQTLAVINVCLFSHILCGRLSIFYAGCDPAFRCPVSDTSVAGVSASRCPVPVSFASGRISFRRQRYYKKEERCSVPFLSFLFLSDFFIFFRFVWFSRCRCSISRKCTSPPLVAVSWLREIRPFAAVPLGRRVTIGGRWAAIHRLLVPTRI